MMQCVAEGHEVVALANLKPQHKDELDSYMYQTVGHQAIDHYADALQRPLYRREIQGHALELDAVYQETKDDEVEDLYELLFQIKEELNVNAVAVGAILSDYQRVRVENVCNRLGLTALAYLWRRDQAELLAEMIACHVEAVVIKVAALGLTPKDHLGKTIKELYPHLLKMSGTYGLNVCGEGGEYETFTLDCPLFVKRIVVDEFETVLHSDDAFAPVAYLNFKRMHLEDKHIKYNMREHLLELPLKHSSHLETELFPQDCEEDQTKRDVVSFASIDKSLYDGLEMWSSSSETELQSQRSVKRTPDGYVWMSGFTAQCVNDDSIEDCAKAVLDELIDTLTLQDLCARDLVAIHLYISSMKDFAAINSVYRRYFSVNPPVRVCVEAPLARNTSLSMDCVAYDNRLGSLDRRVMHVQGISHWAPANIGPYSQAIMIGPQVFVAGQIALCPATMTMIDDGARAEAHLSLRHVDRILKAMNSQLGLCHITLTICYITHVSVISSAAEALQRFLHLEVSSSVLQSPDILKSDMPLVAYVHVPTLPRGAQIEWHVVAVLSEGTSNQRESVETSILEGSVIFNIHARKQWTSEESFILPFVISVEKPNVEITAEISLQNMVSNLLSQLADLLSKQGCTWKILHCLRLFYAAEKCPQPDLQNAYNTAFCRIFESSRDENPTAFIPVVGFQSTHCFMILCHS